MKQAIFQKLDGGKLKISIQALNSMMGFIQNTFYKREAGGVLLGRYIRDSLDIIIDEVTTPMWGDRRGWFSFFRARRSHQKIIDKVWRDSGETIVYLGEWHTHPENIPTPSTTDVKNWKRKLKEDKFDGDSLYFIIIGIETFKIWEFHQKNFSPKLIGEFSYIQE